MLTTCGEVIEMILDTARAACHIDYPTDRYRIIICDDDDDKDLAEAARPLLKEFPHLFYQARAKYPGIDHHYKAGNLQSGIDFVAALPGGAGEYLATLDADMIPHPEWLRCLLPHLLRDPMLGLVSPPQVKTTLPSLSHCYSIY
jgi:cellulose synthase/poly-beta-1,6-N-acetylglucosamine synthase-like glycosyltransferase